MDMYQKRKMRQEKKDNSDTKLTKVEINWYIPTYGKITTNPYK